MDLLAHAAYGVTFCSRTGLAGGSKGPTGPADKLRILDWTVWAAALFGILPDVVSMGPPLVAFAAGGMHGNFFRDMPPESLALYHWTHSLIVALAVSGILRLAWKPLFIPSLAWPLHVLMDSWTHGAGKFLTPIFFPLSAWGINGLRWWQHPGVVLAYWLVLPAIWLGLWFWRKKENGRELTPVIGQK
jgi:hypothetical protein